MKRLPGRLTLVTGVAGVVAIGLVGFLVLQSASGGTFGASSPEAATTALAAAISKGDVLAIANLLPPDERSTLLENGLSEGRSVMQQVGFNFPAIKLAMTPAQVEQLGPDVAAVSWTATWSIDLVRNGGVLAQLVGKDHAVRSGRTTEPSRLRLIMIERDGRWFIDPLLTLGAFWVGASYDLPQPDYSRVDNATPTGAASANDAVSQVLNALVSKRPSDAESALAPAEARFVSVFGLALDQLASRVSENVSFSDVQVADAGDGFVKLTGAHIDESSYDSSVSVDLTGRCATWTNSGGYGYTNSGSGCILGDPALRSRLGIDTLPIAVDQDSSGYHVDLFRTAANLLDILSGKLGADTISALLQGYPPLAVVLGHPKSLAVGSTTTGQNSDRPSVYDVHLNGGDAISLRDGNTDPYDTTHVYERDADGHWQEMDPGQTYFSAAAPTDLRIVIYPAGDERVEYCRAKAGVESYNAVVELLNGCSYGAGTGSFTLSVKSVPASNVVLPATLTPSGNGDVTRYDFTLTKPEVFRYQNEGETFWFSPAWDTTGALLEGNSSGLVRFDKGPHELYSESGYDGSTPGKLVLSVAQP